ncbi:MAG: VWA domain-containing protein [Gammaproteobacteria bacterium]|nr:MAG: VWA domain-containing protein [Gammaproteobacteria bacterium]
MIQFAWPWLALALPLPWLLRRLLPPVSAGSERLRVPFLDELATVQSSHAGKGQQRSVPRLRLLLAVLAWILLVLAAMRPQWIGEPVSLPGSGRDIMLAVDISGSMQTEDFVWNGRPIDRLTAAKLVASRFLERRKGDRVGLILFGTHAYLQAPLSFDLESVRRMLMRAIVGAAGPETAIGDAIGLAIRHLKDRPEGDRVLILMTDGRNTAGNVDPLEAARMAARFGIRIHTIGIGADEVVIQDFFGGRRINPSTDLDEKTLREIAKITGGRYFRGRDLEELEKIYDLIDQMEPVQQDERTWRPLHALFPWPLALSLLLGTLVLLDWRRRA